eukprot:SAG25_NODE_1249_length_3494_cov_27.356805_4_plen_151_part_00
MRSWQRMHAFAGHGLSYTSFSYEWSSSTMANVSRALSTDRRLGDVGYEVVVSNTGSVAGDAVVLGFINSTDTQFPRQKLFDFLRVRLTPGQNKTVLLTVTAEDLSVVDDAGARWLQPAGYTVRAGDVVSPARHDFELRGQPTLLETYLYN